MSLFLVGILLLFLGALFKILIKDMEGSGRIKFMPYLIRGVFTSLVFFLLTISLWVLGCILLSIWLIGWKNTILLVIIFLILGKLGELIFKDS